VEVHKSIMDVVVDPFMESVEIIVGDIVETVLPNGIFVVPTVIELFNSFVLSIDPASIPFVIDNNGIVVGIVYIPPRDILVPLRDIELFNNLVLSIEPVFIDELKVGVPIDYICVISVVLVVDKAFKYLFVPCVINVVVRD
jgi:hypothetical protein